MSTALRKVLETAEKLAERKAQQEPTTPSTKALDPKQASARIKRFRGEEESLSRGILVEGEEIWATDGSRVAVIPNRCGMPDGIYGGRLLPYGKPENPREGLLQALKDGGLHESGRSRWLFRADCLRAAAKCATAYGKEKGVEDCRVMFEMGTKMNLTARGWASYFFGPVFEGIRHDNADLDSDQLFLTVHVSAKYIVEAVMGLSSQTVVVEIGPGGDNHYIVFIERHDGERHYIMPHKP